MVTPRETERKEFLPNSASLTLLWIFQWARYFDRFCLARIFLFEVFFSIIVQTHSTVTDYFLISKHFLNIEILKSLWKLSRVEQLGFGVN